MLEKKDNSFSNKDNNVYNTHNGTGNIVNNNIYYTFNEEQSKHAKLFRKESKFADLLKCVCAYIFSIEQEITKIYNHSEIKIHVYDVFFEKVEHYKLDKNKYKDYYNEFSDYFVQVIGYLDILKNEDYNLTKLSSYFEKKFDEKNLNEISSDLNNLLTDITDNYFNQFIKIYDDLYKKFSEKDIKYAINKVVCYLFSYCYILPLNNINT